MDTDSFVFEDEGFEIDFDGRGYRFEPECSEEEFLRRKAAFEARSSMESSDAPVDVPAEEATARSRELGGVNAKGADRCPLKRKVFVALSGTY